MFTRYSIIYLPHYFNTDTLRCDTHIVLKSWKFIIMAFVGNLEYMSLK